MRCEEEGVRCESHGAHDYCALTEVFRYYWSKELDCGKEEEGESSKSAICLV